MRIKEIISKNKMSILEKNENQTVRRICKLILGINWLRWQLTFENTQASSYMQRTSISSMHWKRDICALATQIAKQ